MSGFICCLCHELCVRLYWGHRCDVYVRFSRTVVDDDYVHLALLGLASEDAGQLSLSLLQEDTRTGGCRDDVCQGTHHGIVPANDSAAPGAKPGVDALCIQGATTGGAFAGDVGAGIGGRAGAPAAGADEAAGGGVWDWHGGIPACGSNARSRTAVVNDASSAIISVWCGTERKLAVPRPDWECSIAWVAGVVAGS